MMICIKICQIRAAIVCAAAALVLTNVPSDAYTIHAARPDVPAGFLAPPNLVTDHIVAQNDYIRCREPVFDFGTLRGGPDRKFWHAFEIENICDRPVRIRVVEACACLYEDNRPWIQPGESVFVGFSRPLNRYLHGEVTYRVNIQVIDIGEPAD